MDSQHEAIQHMPDFSGFFKKHRLKPEMIYAGFSGGADSTALLLMLNDFCRETSCKIKAIHFEHGLRGREGLEDSIWCEKFCETRKIPFRSVPLNVPARLLKNEGIEEAARRLRLEFWRTHSTSPGYFVALAHNADDVVENLFLRLLRGSNSSGLSSLREFQTVGAVKIIRPLLGRSRSEIENYLISNAINDWRVDSSNAENRYRRNFIRNVVIKAIKEEIPDYHPALTKSIRAIRCDADCIERMAELKYRKLSNPKILPVGLIKRSHPAILVRIIRFWLSNLKGRDTVLRADSLERIFSDAKSFAGNTGKASKNSSLIPAGEGLMLKISKEGLSVFEARAEKAEYPTAIWRINEKDSFEFGEFTFDASFSRKLAGFKISCKDEDIVHFDSEAIPHELTLRFKMPGDRMIPFGSTKAVKLKHLLENAKIPQELRNKTPLLCLPTGEIIWIPGLRRSNYAPIGPKTKRILSIRCMKRAL